MKKIIITLATALLLSLGTNAMAQSDNYFSDWNEYREDPTLDPTAPLIPASHGENSDQSAPLGSGLLLLAGLGVAYAMKKK